MINFRDQILDEMKNALGDAWNGLSDNDRQQILLAAMSAAAMLADGPTERDVSYIEATLANVKTAGAIQIKETFFTAVERVARASLATLLKLLGK